MFNIINSVKKEYNEFIKGKLTLIKDMAFN